MNKVFYFFGLLYVIIFSSNLTAQSFKEYKNTKEGKYVYFSLTGVRDTEHAQEINSVLLKDQNVTECTIYASRESFIGKMLIKGNIDADYFRKILQTMQVDFDPSSIIDYNSAFDTKISDHYPLFIDTGNPEKDKVIYDNAKKSWIKNYPKEVIKVTGRNYYEVVLNESFYTNEKPSYIDTGDSELDQKMFEKREQEWNKKNNIIK